MKKKNDKNSSVFLNEENDKVLDSNIDYEDLQGIDIVQRNREELDLERNKRINKFERNASGQMIERSKIRYKISIKYVVIAIIIITIIAYVLYNYGPIFGIHVKPVVTDVEKSKIELVTKESDLYGEYNGELYVYSNNTITTYNDKCEVTWTHNFVDSFSPQIYVKGKYMLVTNNSVGMMYLFENNNEILNKKIDGKIKNAFLDKYGNMAIEYSVETGYNNMVTVFNKSGNNLYDAHLSQENIISMEMLDNSQRIIFSEAVSDSSTIGIKFKEIDITQNDENKLREIISLDNEFVYDYRVEGKDIYALLNGKIVAINIDSGKMDVLKEFNDAQLIFVAINDNYYTYVQRNTDNNNYTIENVGYNGSSISSASIDSVPKNMINSGFINYYIYQDRVHIINKWGVDLGTRDTHFTPKKCVVFNNDKSLALIYTNKIYIVNL